MVQIKEAVSEFRGSLEHCTLFPNLAPGGESCGERDFVSDDEGANPIFTATRFLTLDKSRTH